MMGHKNVLVTTETCNYQEEDFSLADKVNYISVFWLTFEGSLLTGPRPELSFLLSCLAKG